MRSGNKWFGKSSNGMKITEKRSKGKSRKRQIDVVEKYLRNIGINA